MIDKNLIDILNCPECHTPLTEENDKLHCDKCGNIYKAGTYNNYIDMRPASISSRKSVYGDEEFVQKRGQLNPGPPFLSGGIKNWVLRKMIPFKKGDWVLDAGCGPGRYILWNLDSGADFVGLDQEPFFSDKITDNSRLVQGFLHFMPFAHGVFDAIITLDVLEHMGINDIKKFFKQSYDSLKEDGKLFIYTNSTESSALAPVIRFRQRITAYYVRKGKVDFNIEKESKEDHVNALKTLEELNKYLDEAGFQLVDSTYYNPVFMGWFENLFIKLVEHRWNHKIKKGKKNIGTSSHGTKSAKEMIKGKTDRKGLFYCVFWMITQIMKLDIILFSNIKAGQFFLVYEKKPANPETGYSLTLNDNVD